MSIYQVVVKGTWRATNQLRNILHYEFPGYIPNSTELQDFVDNLDDDYKDYLRIHFSEEVAFSRYGLRRVDIAEQPEAELVPTAGTWSGTAASNELPGQLSAMFTVKAFTAYPRSTRTFLFPFTTGAVNTDGLLDSAVVTAIVGFANDHITVAVTGQSSSQRVAVEYGGDPRAVVDYNVVETVVVPTAFRTQRRRRRGVGS